MDESTHTAPGVDDLLADAEPFLDDATPGRTTKDHLIRVLAAAVKHQRDEVAGLRAAIGEFFELKDAAPPLGMSDEECQEREAFFTRQHESELWLRSQARNCGDDT
jgi:hypothetical protein